MNLFRNSRWCVVALVVAALCPTVAQSQLVDLASGPVFSARQPHPNVVVTTSVEFPSVGAAYLNTTGYSSSATYLGYFDATKCYLFSGDSVTGMFKVSGAASTAHECSNAFSGNFMNWITMSAIDEFRYAMTGGNRVDENGPSNGVVLQRATLPDGSVTGVPSFYNLGSNFPAQYIDAGGSGGTGRIYNYANGTIYTTSLPSAVLPSSLLGSGYINIASCGNYVYFSTTVAGTCNIGARTGPSNVIAGGALPVRVLVCDNTEGPTRGDLCLQYVDSSGKYKPVGQAQLNASGMRFASFGYLMDRNSSGYTVPSGCDDGSTWNRCRYGGVLRSPMKYLGPTNYDGSLKASVNLKSEINVDGTLNNDPEGTASGAGGTYSGFINFINKFGSDGVYKRLDPMGEMFYEAIRYYQNLGPTPDAISGTINNATKGNFPYLASWSDPIISSCAANYVINLSDANTWDDTYLPGYAGSPSAGYRRPASRAIEGGLDAVLWTKKIGDLESSTTSLVTDDVRPGLAGLQNRNIANNASYLAAGAAFWANTNDIRADLTGKQTIKTISFDVAEPSIDIHDRQLYLMGKYGGFNNTIDRPSDTTPNPFFAADPTDPSVGAIRSNSEWEDSLGSAYPANYLLASDPQKLIDGLRAAFARINASTGTLSGASLTSANLTYGAANAYIATFNPSRWSGSVLQKSLSVDPTTGDLVVSPGALWDAGAVLTARCGTVAAALPNCQDTYTGATKRNIVTAIRAVPGKVKKPKKTKGVLVPIPTTGPRTAVKFTYAAISADPSFKAAMDFNPATAASDGRGDERVDYIRGYRGSETGKNAFRLRDSVMGDVINSGPIFVGPPSTSIPDADYQAFYTANKGRPGMVYVGANDGMLHGFASADGTEVLAYIPEYSKLDLTDLTDPAYSHEAFVDTVPKIQEAKVNGIWKTVLVGTNGSGAQGLFALDVTNPSSFGPSSVLLEFSDADDPDFGSVLAQPEIAKLKVGVSGGVPVYKYFAVVSGYNNKRTDYFDTLNYDTDVSADTQNKGVLFLLSLDHALGTNWVLGSDYYKVTFPATNAALPNGLGPVTLLQSRSGDGSTDAMYFGDLQGNLWRFNTAGGTPSSWISARGTVAAPLPIFIATDASGTLQPITARPELGSGPFGSVLVFFGTGQYLGASDSVLPAAQQSEYAFLDTAPSTIVSRAADLVPRTGTLSGKNVTVSGAAFSYSGPSAKKGWYFDFPSSVSVGERSITKPALGSGVLTFTTLTLSADICGSGSGYVYQVNALSGLTVGGATAIGYTSTVGIPGPPRIVDLTLTGGADRATGEVINNKRQAVIVSGTTANIDNPGEVIKSKAVPTGRINWREISNWNDLTHH